MKNDKKINKRQYAYEVIRTRILDGTYVPGQRIIIDQIAREVGTSHIPVREAIHQLESDQFIEYKPNFGAVVRGIDRTLYMETLQLLALLEGYATSLSASHIPHTAIGELKAINHHMKETLKNYDLEKLGDLNRKFHFAIYAFCPNKLLVQNIQQVWERMDIVRRTNFTFFSKRMPKSIEEHDLIIQLLEEKADRLQIENVARTHKLNTLETFKQQQ